MGSGRGMPRFELVTQYPLAGDQPKATAQLAEGIPRGDRAQTLLGVTGSGTTLAGFFCRFSVLVSP